MAAYAASTERSRFKVGAVAMVGRDFEPSDLAAGKLSNFLELRPCDEALQAGRPIDSEAIPRNAIALAKDIGCIRSVLCKFELIAPIPAWFRLGLVSWSRADGV